jgi:hypothetical protein
MQRIIRNRRLTPEEAEKYRRIRKLTDKEFQQKKPFRWWMYLLAPLSIILLPLFLIFMPFKVLAAVSISFFCDAFNIKEPKWVSSAGNYVNY